MEAQVKHEISDTPAPGPKRCYDDTSDSVKVLSKRPRCKDEESEEVPIEEKESGRVEEAWPLLQLPMPLIAHVSSFLGCAGELKFGRVCKSFHNLVMSHLTAAELHTGQLRRVCRLTPRITTLTWTLNGGEAPNCQPTTVLARLQQLESLTLILRSPFSRWSLPRNDYSPSYPAVTLPSVQSIHLRTPIDADVSDNVKHGAMSLLAASRCPQLLTLECDDLREEKFGWPWAQFGPMIRPSGSLGACLRHLAVQIPGSDAPAFFWDLVNGVTPVLHSLRVRIAGHVDRGQVLDVLSRDTAAVRVHSLSHLEVQFLQRPEALSVSPCPWQTPPSPLSADRRMGAILVGYCGPFRHVPSAVAMVDEIVSPTCLLPWATRIRALRMLMAEKAKDVQKAVARAKARDLAYVIITALLATPAHSVLALRDLVLLSSFNGVMTCHGDWFLQDIMREFLEQGGLAPLLDCLWSTTPPPLAGLTLESPVRAVLVVLQLLVQEVKPVIDTHAPRHLTTRMFTRLIDCVVLSRVDPELFSRSPRATVHTYLPGPPAFEHERDIDTVRRLLDLAPEDVRRSAISQRLSALFSLILRESVRPKPHGKTLTLFRLVFNTLGAGVVDTVRALIDAGRIDSDIKTKPALLHLHERLSWFHGAVDPTKVEAEAAEPAAAGNGAVIKPEPPEECSGGGSSQHNGGCAQHNYGYGPGQIRGRKSAPNPWGSGPRPKCSIKGCQCYQQTRAATRSVKSPAAASSSPSSSTHVAAGASHVADTHQSSAECPPSTSARSSRIPSHHTPPSRTRTTDTSPSRPRSAGAAGAAPRPYRASRMTPPGAITITAPVEAVHAEAMDETASADAGAVIGHAAAAGITQETRATTRAASARAKIAQAVPFSKRRL